MADDQPDTSTETEASESSAGSSFIIRLVLGVIGVALSGVYLANPSAGFLEIIPDNIPGIGNLDEVFFSGLFFYCLSLLGIHLLPGRKPKEIDAKK